jgi:2-deoxy-D-gluconate 3-dehydrogenase
MDHRGLTVVPILDLSDATCIVRNTVATLRTDNAQALRDDRSRSDAINARIPAGGWSEPDDLAGAIVFLASSASDYTHGYVLAVDGGWLAR